MITVHHLNRSRSTRILWLLEELGMDYQRVDHQRDSTTHLAPESLKAIHPLGKAPVIVDGPVTICESSTIVEYILDQNTQNKLRPVQGTPAYYQYLEWSHFAEGSLSLPVITSGFLKREVREGKNALDGYIAKEVAVDFSHVETTLSQQAYFAGNEFTAADIMMTISLNMANLSGLLEGRSHTLSYLEKIKQRPAFVKAAGFG
jgi:glutathione S-transferase